MSYVDHTMLSARLWRSLSEGRTIDASGSTETDGARLSSSKSAENSNGHKHICENTVEPLVTALIRLHLEADILTRAGGLREYLDHIQIDGQHVEVPQILWKMVFTSCTSPTAVARLLHTS